MSDARAAMPPTIQRMLERAGIGQKNADGIAVDLRPRPTPAPAPTRPSDPTADPAERWRRMHVLTYQPIRDPYAVLAEIYGATLGMRAKNCRCNLNFADRLTRKPPPVHDRAALEVWGFDTHNEVRREQGRPTLTYDECRRDQPLAVHNTARGLGDAVCGLYAAAGLAKATGRTVEYRSHSSSWLARASYPGLTIAGLDRGQIGVDFNDGTHGYSRQIAAADTRKDAYCRNAAAGYDLPGFLPVRPIVDTSGAEEGRFVVLAPFSCYASREWPAARWRALAEGIIDAGMDVVAVGSSDQRDRMAETLKGLPRTTWRYGCPASEITSLMLGARVVVGNDSGIVHVAGLLDVPAVAVHAGSLPHELLFSLAPSVVSVTAGRRLARSDHNPAALASIPAAEVLAATCNGRSRSHLPPTTSQ